MIKHTGHLRVLLAIAAMAPAYAATGARAQSQPLPARSVPSPAQTAQVQTAQAQTGQAQTAQAQTGQPPAGQAQSPQAQPVAGPAPQAAPAPETPTAALARLASDRAITVSLNLEDLGIDRPISLWGMDARREIFLPVPAGVRIRDAQIKLDGRYLRGDGGHTTYVVSVDGTPQFSRPVEGDKGIVSEILPISGDIRPTGFVNLNLAWSSVISQELCGDERSIGNILEFNPATRFTYTYNASDIRDLATAWSALPPRPVILIPPGELSKATYDAAWRIGTVLQQAGKLPRIAVMPGVGQEVDTSGIVLSPGLAALPAFAAFSGGGRHRIASRAELGAYIALARQGGFSADFVIEDPSIRDQMDQAVRALEDDLRSGSADNASAFAPLRAQLMANAAQGDDNVRLVTIAGKPVIAISAQAAAQASGVLSDLWRQMLVVPAANVRVATTPDFSGVTSIDLSRLGGRTGTFDVLARGDWSATFDLGTLLGGGRVPSEFLVDVSAAPSAGDSAPIASIMLNDYLLGARRLSANGITERIPVQVPRYALAARNVLKISFQRQPMSDRCRETPQAFPVAVLPSSRAVLVDAPSTIDFFGAMPRLATRANVIVPQAYLRDPATLRRVISLAVASGVTPERAILTVAGDGAEITPDGAFLAIDTRIGNVASKVKVEGSRLAINGSNEQTMLDVGSLNNLGVIEAVMSGRQIGLVYRTIGANAPDWKKPFLLTAGDISLLASTGPAVTLDTNSATLTRDTAGESDAFSSFLKRGPAWGPAAVGVAILLFLLFVVLAQRARRRTREEP
ncbi:hypothetical protein [Roseixanthobacter liquoris]|uniref:hypothetical protein n=1 Tax=Roseixanthobacter liquoris TaxID=3119921 RepID=UPI0037279EA1